MSWFGTHCDVSRKYVLARIGHLQPCKRTVYAVRFLLSAPEKHYFDTQCERCGLNSYELRVKFFES